MWGEWLVWTCLLSRSTSHGGASPTGSRPAPRRSCRGMRAHCRGRTRTFSVVTVMGSFECFPEPEKVLAELYRVLRRGGRAVMNIGESVEPGTPTHRMLDALWVWSEDDVRHMVEQAGFTDVAMTYGSTAVNRLDELISKRMGGIAADMRTVHATKV